MSERFTDELHQRARAIWEAQHEHPFVRGIGDGTLDVERFKFWLRQDYLFLIDYARLLATGAARAPDLETMRRLAELAHSTLSVEMDMHRSYAAEFDISTGQLEATEKAPTTRAYTDFLLRVAVLGDFAELVAALLPCMWGYCEIGERLAAGPRPNDVRYGKWIAMYASGEFAELAVWCRELLDRLAGGMTEEARARLGDAFLVSSRYELQFWEMAWRLEA
jgi:thiaminase/transcriptional activator TenA